MKPDFRMLAFCGTLMIAMPVFADDVQKEEPVDPYTISNENAGADPLGSTDVFNTFGGKDGISRIVDDFVDRLHADPRTEGIFHAADNVRLKRTLKEQFCYLLAGPCDYTGRDMVSVHEEHGITNAEFNALVECLQAAMDAEGIPFRTQNKLLAILAPMQREIVVR